MKSGIKILFAAMVLLMSCSEKAKDEMEKMKDEVMAVHDEIMPKMSELRKLKKALREQAKDAANSAELERVADKIEEANEGMMDWMRNYKAVWNGTEKEYDKYIKEQKKKINKVRKSMEEAMEEGKRLLEKQKKK